jgi:hypothetical protein
MVQGTLQSLILTGIPASCNCPITDQAHTPAWILGNIILSTNAAGNLEVSFTFKVVCCPTGVIEPDPDGGLGSCVGC